MGTKYLLQQTTKFNLVCHVRLQKVDDCIFFFNKTHVITDSIRYTTVRDTTTRYTT